MYAGVGLGAQVLVSQFGALGLQRSKLGLCLAQGIDLQPRMRGEHFLGTVESLGGWLGF